MIAAAATKTNLSKLVFQQTIISGALFVFQQSDKDDFEFCLHTICTFFSSNLWFGEKRRVKVKIVINFVCVFSKKNAFLRWNTNQYVPTQQQTSRLHCKFTIITLGFSTISLWLAPMGCWVGDSLNQFEWSCGANGVSYIEPTVYTLQQFPLRICAIDWKCRTMQNAFETQFHQQSTRAQLWPETTQWPTSHSTPTWSSPYQWTDTDGYCQSMCGTRRIDEIKRKLFAWWLIFELWLAASEIVVRRSNTAAGNWVLSTIGAF